MALTLFYIFLFIISVLLQMQIHISEKTLFSWDGKPSFAFGIKDYLGLVWSKKFILLFTNYYSCPQIIDGHAFLIFHNVEPFLAKTKFHY